MSASALSRGPRSALVIALSGVGDVLLTTPVLRDLREAWPELELEVLVMQGPAARDVLEDNPDVDRVIFHNFMAESRLRSLRLLWGLRRRQYDLVVLPMPHNRLVYNAIAWVIGGSLRVGMKYARRCGSAESLLLHRVIEEDEGVHLNDNNRALLEGTLGLNPASPPTAPAIYLKDQSHTAARKYLSQWEPAPWTLGVHAGSGGTKNLALKRWPLERWVELFAQLGHVLGKGRILIFGGSEEESLRSALAAESSRVCESVDVVAVPTIPVQEVAAIVEKIDAFCSADTLLGHLAVAVDTPSVVLFGPTPVTAVAARKQPRYGRHSVVSAGLPCSPCYGYSRHGIRCTNPVPMRCLRDLSVSKVLEGLVSLLADRPQGHKPAAGGFHIDVVAPEVRYAGQSG